MTLCGSAALTVDYTIRVGSIVSEMRVDTITMRDVFKPMVEKDSGDRITVELYPNAQLGGIAK